MTSARNRRRLEAKASRKAGGLMPVPVGGPGVHVPVWTMPRIDNACGEGESSHRRDAAGRPLVGTAAWRVYLGLLLMTGSVAGEVTATHDELARARPGTAPEAMARYLRELHRAGWATIREQAEGRVTLWVRVDEADVDAAAAAEGGTDD